MKQPFPRLTTDTEAEDFVATADLAAHAVSTMIPMRFVLRRKDEAIYPRLPRRTPPARDLFGVIGYLQQQAGVQLHVLLE